MSLQAGSLFDLACSEHRDTFLARMCRKTGISGQPVSRVAKTVISEPLLAWIRKLSLHIFSRACDDEKKMTAQFSRQFHVAEYIVGLSRGPQIGLHVPRSAS